MPVLMPVYSPLRAGGLRSGLAATASAAKEAVARHFLESWLRGGDAARDVLLVDSGTSALTLALAATATEVARPVAIPAFACFDIATAVDGAGVPFVFYDLDPSTMGPDVDSLRRALETGANRIVVVHLYGIPVDLDQVGALAKEFGALVIEDAAQGVGASWKGRVLGECGSLGIVSFGRGKGLTGGGGGALLGNDRVGREAVARVRDLVARGSTAGREIITTIGQWALARRALYFVPASIPFFGLGETTYRESTPARGISAFALGVLSRSVPLADAESRSRRRNAERLLARVDDSRLQRIRPSPDGVPGYLRLPLLASVPLGARGLAAARRLGIMPSYPQALSRLDGFAHRHCGAAGPTTGALRLATHLITVPVHGALTDTDLAALESWCARTG